jgi:hypothetical protein
MIHQDEKMVLTDEEIKELEKQRRKRNYQKFKEYHRKYYQRYYEENKEKIVEMKKEYFNKNKDKIYERLKEKVECECGRTVSRGELSKHKKTAIHQKFLQQLQNKN